MGGGHLSVLHQGVLQDVVGTLWGDSAVPMQWVFLRKRTHPCLGKGHPRQPQPALHWHCQSGLGYSKVCSIFVEGPRLCVGILMILWGGWELYTDLFSFIHTWWETGDHRTCPVKLWREFCTNDGLTSVMLVVTLLVLTPLNVGKGFKLFQVLSFYTGLHSNVLIPCLHLLHSPYWAGAWLGWITCPCWQYWT